MSLTPKTTPTPETAPELVPALPSGKRVGRWRRRLWVVLFALFAFEIGAFLVVFPWMDSWSLNHLPSFFPSNQIAIQDLWDEPYFRAVAKLPGAMQRLYCTPRDRSIDPPKQTNHLVRVT